MGSSNCVVNRNLLLNLYKKYDVKVNFGGHLHTQHIAKENDFLEILTSSLSLNPCHYGIIHSSKGKWNYHTENLDVSSYAKKMGYADSNLLNFSSFVDGLFDKTNSYNLCRSFEEDESLSEDKKTSLKQTVSLLNKVYFYGGPLERNEDIDKKIEELQSYLVDHKSDYISEIIEELLTGCNYNSIDF